jgi:hypothetical protein
MSTISKTHPGAGWLDALLSWLTGDDGEKLVAAVTLLMCEGPAVNEFLLIEAAKSATPVAHILRLLDLAERIGGTLTSADRARLRGLRHHWSGAVKRKAAEVLAVLPARRQSRRSGSGGLLRRLALARKLAMARAARQGTVGGLGGRSRSVPAGRKPVATASRLPAS